MSLTQPGRQLGLVDIEQHLREPRTQVTAEICKLLDELNNNTGIRQPGGFTRS